MSERFKAPSREELAARGLDPDGAPIKPAPKAKEKAKPKADKATKTEE